MIKLTLNMVIELFKEEQDVWGCLCDTDYNGCPYIREVRFVEGVERGDRWLGGTP